MSMLIVRLLLQLDHAASNAVGCHSDSRSFTLGTWATSCFVLVFKEAKFANSVLTTRVAPKTAFETFSTRTIAFNLDFSKFCFQVTVSLCELNRVKVSLLKTETFRRSIEAFKLKWLMNCLGQEINWILLI